VRVALVDYGVGNLPSVERALGRLGAVSQRVHAPEAIEGAEGIILPGVGHYGALVRALHAQRLFNPLRAALEKGTPFLGICLGLHALYDESEEAPDHPGLGLLPGRVEPLPRGVKVPHMGWNRVRSLRDSALLQGVSGDAWLYFAHSYAARSIGSEVVGVTDHGGPIVAAVERGNVWAVQFHPEKSGSIGSRILRNFLERVA
jgi:imidazole glycerol phosphate synthase glutamine amidotransferase subunit